MSIIHHKLKPYKGEKLKIVNKIKSIIIKHHVFHIRKNVNKTYVLSSNFCCQGPKIEKIFDNNVLWFWKNLCGQQKELTRNHFCKITSDKLRPHTILLCNLGQFLSFEWELTLNRNKFLAHCILWIFVSTFLSF